jgi:hypothetical protein
VLFAGFTVFRALQFTGFTVIEFLMESRTLSILTMKHNRLESPGGLGTAAVGVESIILI